MRPRELTLEGFRSYRARTTFDFRDRRLIGIVGPIGSGKSTILDGIAFALFGRTPTVDARTRSLVHQLEDVAHVQLVFEVEGEVWRVTRGLRRKGQSGHKLERLNSDAPDAPPLDVIDGERAVRDRIVSLLGMDFDTFCRSVLLAQNRFADFLRARPGERDGVLKGVFGYERFDAALAGARVRMAEAEGLVAGLHEEGGRLAGARAELDDVRARAAEAERRAAAIEEARPTVDELTATRARAARAREEATQRIATVERAAAAIPVAAEIDGATAAHGAAETTATAAAADLEVADAELAAATAARDAAAAAAGDLRSFTQLVARMHAEAEAVGQAAERRRRATETAAEALAAVGAARERLEGAQRDADRADEAHTELADVAATADVALHDARHANMAKELRRELVAGAPCPVCAQPVASPPAPGRAPAVRTAERAAQKAGAALAAGAARREDARGAVTGARERVAAAEERAGTADTQARTAEEEIRRAEEALTLTQGQVVDRLGEGDPQALLDERERTLREAEERRETATAAVSAARTTLDTARAAVAETAATLASMAVRLASGWGLLGETRDVAPTETALHDAFVALGTALTQMHEDASRARTDAEAEEDAAVRDLAGHLAALDLEPDADFAAALADATAARAAARERLRQLEEVLAAGEDLQQRIDHAAERLALARRLRDDLQPSRFLAWTLAEERAALAELGSVHLEELTAGAYRFTDDDTFHIVDVQGGGAERSAESLSGGETFLASLALALGLAEMVTRGGGRLDAFFLDEGFGSLDPDRLERAMDGIGRLVAAGAGRLVVLVSHVELMRQMLEDLIVLEKDDRTGTTIVRSGAAPATG